MARRKSNSRQLLSVGPYLGVGPRQMPYPASAAVRINENGQKIIYLPKGETVKLGCPFASDPEDNTPDSDWDIEWQQVRPGPHPQSNRLLGYHDHQVIYPGPPDYRQRVGFTSADPSLYDASMQLRDLQIADSATYECRVKKTTEASHRVTITVQERPVVPQCLILGDIAYGGDITLRCVAGGGSPPLSYRWSMTHGDQFRDWLPPVGSIGSAPGDLRFHDLSEDDAGTYQCAVGNNVGVAYCTVDIFFESGLSYSWLVIGAILIAALTAAIIAVSVTWCCCCCCGRSGCGGCGGGCGGGGCGGGGGSCWDGCCGSCNKHEEKQDCVETKGNEICVDAIPPPSRPCSQAFSRASSLHSLLGFKTANVQYTQGRKFVPPIVQVKTTPLPEPDVNVVVPADLPSPPCSEGGDVVEHYYATKVQGTYSPASSEARYIKGEDQEGSSSPPHIFSSKTAYATTDTTALHWKDGTNRHYKGAVVMMRSSSKEGLLI
ncbi:V-set and immunoglobulin domain-containing protein 8-like [Elgaria multicarinata webbii]|uniref:V-set and immunoglobulin domain-containing protein 8-like n=1 Tax=Elgaria multicarinata webbii TaxID=159646 RepID=UPI002FCCF1B5